VDVGEPPRRTPRPGDPFAGPAADPARPAVRKKARKGRNFFLFLLLTGGVLAGASLVVFVNFKGMTVRFYADVVVPRGIPDALPPDYPRADAEKLVRTLHDFFERADAGRVTDDQVLAVISAIEAAMKDERITPEEARGLIEMARAAGAKG
jgi:hypothetical protein